MHNRFESLLKVDLNYINYLITITIADGEILTEIVFQLIFGFHLNTWICDFFKISSLCDFFIYIWHKIIHNCETVKPSSPLHCHRLIHESKSLSYLKTFMCKYNSEYSYSSRTLESWSTTENIGLAVYLLKWDG